MKKILLSGLASLAAVIAFAGVNERVVTTSARVGVRQMTDRSQFTSQQRARLHAVSVMDVEAPANAVVVPFVHDLGKNGVEVKNYTQFNANGDNREWQVGKASGYGACMAPNADGVDEGDDWLFTVPIHITPGDYVVSFEVGYMGSGAIGVRMDVAMGSQPAVDAMTTVVSPSTTYTTKNMTLYELQCKVADEGYYYLGFHCTTPKDMKGALKLTNVGMKAGEVEAPVDPPAAGTLTWELAPKGELKATVTYTAPTKTKSGADLESISKVVITSRWEVDKFTYEDVEPGQVIVVEDVDMYQGYNNRFTGVAYVGETAGDKVEYKNIFCGKDTPLTPENVKLAPSADYTSAVLSWDAVGEVGENGGYVDPENVTYYIFDAFGSYYDPAIAQVKGETSITMDYENLVGQDFVAYQVTAGYEDSYSLDCASNIVIIGEPDDMPFAESFANGRFSNLWLIDPDTYGMQQYGTVDDTYFPSLIDPDDPDAPEPLVSHDGDNGFYYWMPVDKDVMFGLQSVRVDISKAAKPVLDFWYQGQGSAIDVLVSAGPDELKEVRVIDLKETPAMEWTLARVDLTPYKGAGAVSFGIRLRSIHNDDDHIWSVPVDNISVHDLVDKDLSVIALNAPSLGKAGEQVSLSARVANVGTAVAEGAVIKWLANGKVIGRSEPVDIAANGFANASTAYAVPYNAPDIIEFTASVVLEGDAVEVNNSKATKMTVKHTVFPMVNDLAATPQGESQVTLSWSRPSLEDVGKAEVVTEDFESDEYTPMSITGAGGWTVYDGDGGKTYNMFQELYNPYQTQPMGFQLFNRVVAEVHESYWIDAEPHSGNSFMLAPSAAKALNDNWLISPELSGNAQTVSFWAKSFSVAWPEDFEVYYSTAGNSRGDFTEKLDVTNYPESGGVPEVWTEFSVELPEGAKYFAICHNSYDTYALFVDDVTYEAVSELPEDLEIQGYYIYCNGEAVNDEPHSEEAYVHEPLADDAEPGNYKFGYAVAAVYNHGVARACDEVEASLEYSGIEVVGVDSLDKANARYYDLQGRRVASENLGKGVYVEVKGEQVRKVMIELR